MNKRLALIIALCSLFITSCPAPFDASNPGADYGRVVVDIRGASARTVFPTMSFAKYEYFFSKMNNGQAGDPVKQDPVDGYFMLALGDWKVTIKAYAATGDTEPTATGTSSVFTVTNTHIAQAVVQLAGNTGSGAGSFSYHITYPQNAEVNGFTLKNLVNGSAPTITISGTGVNGEGGVRILSNTRSNVPSGQYLLTIQLKENGDAGRTTGANEVVYIYDKLDSEYAIGFTAEDFSHIHQWNSWAETTPPNCTMRGVDTRRCSYNPSQHYEQRAGAAIVPDAHIYGAWQPDEGDAATVTDDGHETKTCIHNTTHTVNRVARATGTPGLAYELIATGTNANTFRVRRGTAPNGLVIIPVYHLDTISDEYLFVTGIGNSSDSSSNSAFNNFSGLTGITIPTSVTSIGAYAFYYCSGLTSVTIPTSVTSIGTNAFRYCSGLVSVTIPDSVTSIGSSAFYNCSKLNSIVIPTGVTSIASDVFNGCSSLISVTIPDSVTSIGDSAFSQCTKLPSIAISANVTSINSQAFSRCTSLTDITVDLNNNNFTSDGGILYNKDKSRLIAYPSASGIVDNIDTNVTAIGDYAFYSCSNLTGIDIPTTVTSIGERAFYGCSGLTGITIPADLTTIGSNAFYNSGLININIPAGVTTINSQALSNCGSLLSITVDAGNNNFTSDDGILYNKAQTTLIVAPAGKSGSITTIPSTVTSISSYAFYYCEKITGVTIPSGLTSIGSSAFYSCTSITSITIPSGVTTISSSTFNGCSNLINISIPTTVTSIGSQAFWNCSKLTSINISGVTSIGSSAFYQCTSITSITIPASVTSIDSRAFWYWTSSQTINVQGKTQAQADAAWGSGTTNWRSDCNAVINYNYLGT